jgi:hypothetical protein
MKGGEAERSNKQVLSMGKYTGKRERYRDFRIFILVRVNVSDLWYDGFD